jgi:SAM-dependent methyltransferase
MRSPLYDRIAASYAVHRQPDERIAAQIALALHDCDSVLNVGAGSGAYEPKHGTVVAVEPSFEMIGRRSRGAAPAVQAVATELPFKDRSFDAALAVLTIHHWSSWRKGLTELLRVSRDRVVIVTWDSEHSGFWLVRDYLPEILDIDRRIFPPIKDLAHLMGPLAVQALRVPADCRDGFLGAYWRRPAEYLKLTVREAISTFSKVDSVAGVERLRHDLETGVWERRNRHLLSLAELDIGYRIVVAQCRGAQ